MGEQRESSGLHGLKPGIVMVVIQFAYAGVNLLYKLATNDGMKINILIAYRFILASAFLLPLAFFVERRSRPKLTWMILGQAFLCGLFGGSLAQCLYVKSLTLTSTTFASAMTNLIPGLTFILAVSVRLERLNIRAIGGKAKLVGTVLGIGGAMVLTLYKGVEIDIWSTHIDLLHHHDHHHGHLASPQPSDSRSNHVLGCLLAVGCCISTSLWLIIQAKMIQRYPCPYSSTALMSIMASIQTIVFTLCTERDWKQWKLGWNIRLLSVAYLGIVASGLLVALMAWCVRLRGPLYVSVFNPLLLVLVAIAGSLVLNEKLHLGSVLGAVLIVLGLYLVLWGKGKEMNKKSQPLPHRDHQSLDNGGDQPDDPIHVVVRACSADNAMTWSKNDDNINNGSFAKIAPDDEVSNANNIGSTKKEDHDQGNEL